MLMLALIGSIAVIGAFVALDDDDDTEDTIPDNTETGTPGSDQLDGTDGRDLITLGDGDDSSFGGDGDDTIHGDAGADVLGGQIGGDDLYGGDGNDNLYGGAGDDFLSGGADADILEGGGSDDRMTGGGGLDVLLGENGEDTLNGSLGQDLLYGGNDDDVLNGGYGADGLHGGNGEDTVSGGDGDDVINGGELLVDTSLTSASALREAFLDGETSPANLDFLFEDDKESDVLNGDAGNDLLVGGAGDVLNGGTGDDTFLVGDWLQAGEQVIIRDFDVEDEVVLYRYSGAAPDLDYNTVVNSDGSSDIEVTVNGEVVAYLENAGDGFDLASNVALVSA
jgi:Ca2+-binding RTX toxin-like protein